MNKTMFYYLFDVVKFHIFKPSQRILFFLNSHYYEIAFHQIAVILPLILDS